MSDDAPLPKKKGFLGVTLNMTAGRWLMVGVGGLGLVTAMGVYWLETRGANVDAGAHVNVMSDNGVRNTPGKSSPAYAAEVAKYNKQHAAYALSHNQSFVGIPVTGTTSIAPPPMAPIEASGQDGQNQAQQPPPMAPIEAPPPAPQRPQSPAADGAIAKEFGAIAAAMKNGRGINPGMYIPQFDAPARAVSLSYSSSSAAAVSGTASKLPVIRPGTILYGVFENALKSTMPGPVIGELVQGKYNGDRVIGSFTKSKGSNDLLIRLSTLVLPNGKTVQIDAYAVSPSTTLPGMATGVDYHILSRTANFLGAAFISGVEGYGAAVAQQGSTTTSTLGVGTTQTYPMLTPAQTLDIAAGQAAQQLQPLQQIMAANAMEPDTVTVAQGTPFGLLVVSSGSTSGGLTGVSAVGAVPSAGMPSAGMPAASVPSAGGTPAAGVPSAAGQPATTGFPVQRSNLSFPGLTLGAPRP